jgi:soluble lytic murein transglycosylase-like protein
MFAEGSRDSGLHDGCWAHALMAAINIPEVPRAALHYQAQLTREARYAFGMDAPIAVLAGQVHQESAWNPNAKSPYASGLAQFTPGTATWISGINKSLGPAAPLDPAWALRAMVTYDKLLHDGEYRYDSECDRWLFSLSDYNGGNGWRISRQAHSSKPGSWAVTGYINPGISQQSQYENSSYGPRIIYTLQPIYEGWGTTTICLAKG